MGLLGFYLSFGGIFEEVFSDFDGTGFFIRDGRESRHDDDSVRRV